ncbi:hypothetical protein PBRA_002951 [Plasmodiophora brassicae]|uniref:Uncharacterized protein n=1 Tax=Plasmodiophora brassicae TaxID=37360 RepID=A0A0G4J7G9_PLABS|nr:hypothetical protein PBRA_002951 [Plasmodiophora brassicae]
MAVNSGSIGYGSNAGRHSTFVMLSIEHQKSMMRDSVILAWMADGSVACSHVRQPSTTPTATRTRSQRVGRRRIRLRRRCNPHVTATQPADPDPRQSPDLLTALPLD